MYYSVKSSAFNPLPANFEGRGGTLFSGSYRNAPQWEPADMTPLFGQTTCPGSSSRPRAQYAHRGSMDVSNSFILCPLLFHLN